MVAVEVSLTYAEHVEENDQCDCCTYCQSLVSAFGLLAFDCPDDKGEADGDENERSYCVSLEKAYSVDHKGLDKDVCLTGVDASCECSCNAWNECAKEAESCSSSVCYVSCLHKLRFLVSAFQDSVESVESEKRESHLKDDERH